MTPTNTPLIIMMIVMMMIDDDDINDDDDDYYLFLFFLMGDFYFAAKASMKRAAETSASALKDIFDDVTREMGVGGHVAYLNIESTLRKRRRKTFPPLPQTAREAADHFMNAHEELRPYTVNFV